MCTENHTLFCKSNFTDFVVLFNSCSDFSRCVRSEEFLNLTKFFFCSVLKIYNKDYYEVETCGGYYGEEIEGVYFENEKKVVEAFNEVLAFDNDVEKIKFVLELEYGYLLDKVKNAKVAYIQPMATKIIDLPQHEYFVKLDREVIDGYKNRKLPIAVCTECGGRYKLVDGYHRFVANKERATNQIIVLE